MRPFLVIATLSFLAVLAAPAVAQERDPFVPLISEDSGSGTLADDGAFEEPAPPAPAPDNERIADTGAPVQQWVGLALALMGLGAAIVIASTTRRVPAIRHRGASVT